jgi:hypothetical protein
MLEIILVGVAFLLVGIPIVYYFDKWYQEVKEGDG